MAYLMTATSAVRKNHFNTRHFRLINWYLIYSRLLLLCMVTLAIGTVQLGCNSEVAAFQKIATVKK